ncbi:isopentenyl pyrophosphate:dimethyllallyl pyrophosphate isomerase [Achlya hypogyna]|uniref:isopentenyl-diphosphate Delta-isomerase n=1 Tax=Achlya hypogyna TaxID=1202772 RepID=A0A1V9Y539_ACHHY|nr:isopentenyl pyrophosphate:dimethyllallyl pyrophosphate isomerase [Achlya hypogyna]
MVSTSFEAVIAAADETQVKLMEEMCIQVDETDRNLGPISKKDSHYKDGVLHRAFSVFLFTPDNKLMIQKRAAEKITFPNFWANTCCSHPLHFEAELEEKEHLGVKRAAIRKLEHELGIPLDTFNTSQFKFITKVLYRAPYDENWSEYEVDHILLVRAAVKVNINPNEVAEIRLVARDELESVINDESLLISPWFRLISQTLLPQWWDNLDACLEKDNADETIHNYIK